MSETSPSARVLWLSDLLDPLLTELERALARRVGSCVIVSAPPELGQIRLDADAGAPRVPTCAAPGRTWSRSAAPSAHTTWRSAASRTPPSGPAGRASAVAIGSPRSPARQEDCSCWSAGTRASTSATWGSSGWQSGPCEDDPGRRLIWRTATGCRQPAWQIGAHLPATGSAGGPRRGRTMAQVFGPQPR